jgi:hypothetical protein
MVDPGDGEATAEAPEPDGNQLMMWGTVVSQVSGTAEIQTDPATAVRWRVTTLVGAGRTRLIRCDLVAP